jgi:hypothetical protein
MLDADPRQVALLATTLLVPAVLLFLRRDRELVAWICFTTCIDIFSTSILVNLPAARVAGLLLLTRAEAFVRMAARTRSGRALIWQCAYLACLAVLFGLLFPWPSGGVLRSFNQIAPGRAFIQLVRFGADLAVALFVASYVLKSRRPEFVFKAVLAGTSVAALGGVLEYLTRIDLYGSITGLIALSLEYRMRGFNYEPRGLGLIATLGLLLSLILFSRRRTVFRVGLLGLHATALVLAGSTSAVIVLAAGAVALFVFDPRSRLVMATSAGAVVLVAAVSSLESDYLAQWRENAKVRLTTERIDRDPRNIVENLAFRMDVLDGPALLFLASNPLYLLIGTGPGLVSLPATDYLPPSASFLWLADTGINSPPTSGFLLELSNTGVVGMVLWWVVSASSLRSLKALARRRVPDRTAWSIGRAAFVVALACYAAQASPLSVFWPVFLGTGLGADAVVRSLRQLRAARKAPGVQEDGAGSAPVR